MFKMSFYNGVNFTYFGIYIILLCNILAIGSCQTPVLATSRKHTTIIPETTSLEPNHNAPLEFPKNDSQYNIIHNSTILANLTHHNQNDTEVSDLNGGGFLVSTTSMQFLTTTTQSLDALAKLVFNEHNFKTTSKPNAFPKSEAELIQIGNNEDTRDAERNSLDQYESHGGGVPMVQGQLAAICAGIFVVLAVLGYVGLLSWRRFLEHRYGNREMLVNEEDMYDPTDMRHFSL